MHEGWVKTDFLERFEGVEFIQGEGESILVGEEGVESGKEGLPLSRTFEEECYGMSERSENRWNIGV